MMKKILIYGPHAFLFLVIGMGITMYLSPSSPDSGAGEVGPLTEVPEYTDVPPGHWAAASVRWVGQLGIMTGDAETKLFNPDGPVNRAGLATVTHRLYRNMNKRLSALETQLKEAAVAHQFIVSLDGKQQPPGIETQATGAALIIMNDDSLWYSVNVQNVKSKAVSGHMHIGDFGDDDKTVATFAFTNNMAAGAITDISYEDREAILGGRAYINIHTSQYTKGEIAGRIQAVDGEDAPAPVAITASGAQN